MNDEHEQQQRKINLDKIPEFDPKELEKPPITLGMADKSPNSQALHAENVSLKSGLGTKDQEIERLRNKLNQINLAINDWSKVDSIQDDQDKINYLNKIIGFVKNQCIF